MPDAIWLLMGRILGPGNVYHVNAKDLAEHSAIEEIVNSAIANRKLAAGTTFTKNYKMVSCVKPHDFLKWAESRFSIPAELRPLLDTLPAPIQTENQTAPTQNTFKQISDSWKFFYDGMKAPIEGVKDQKGFHYIKHLLMNPLKDFSATELEAGIYGPAEISPLVLEPQCTSENLQYQNTKSLRNLKDYLDEQLIKQAEEDSPRIKGTQDKLREIEDELDRRRYAPENLQRDNIRKLIKKAIETLQAKTENDPSLYQHLNKHLLPIKWPISYKPEQPTSWAG